jgi:hypothetical protein
MVNLREIEHEYNPSLGDLGRGLMVDRREVDSIDTSGFEPFEALGCSNLLNEIQVYEENWKTRPDRLVWRGWVREENGKHFVAGIEYRK